MYLHFVIGIRLDRQKILNFALRMEDVSVRSLKRHTRQLFIKRESLMREDIMAYIHYLNARSFDNTCQYPVARRKIRMPPLDDDLFGLHLHYFSRSL